MMRLFFPGQNVPEWLEKVEPKHAQSILGTLTFSSVVIVYSSNGAYHIKPIVGDYSMTLSYAESVTLVGQSPCGGSGGVVHYSALMDWWGFSIAGCISVYLISFMFG